MSLRYETLQACARAEEAGEDVAVNVTALLVAGADPHETDRDGQTAFNAAAVNAPVTGRLLTLHWFNGALANRGSKGLNDISGAHGSTLAQYIAKWALDEEIADILARGVAAGMKVDAPNNSGWTPLTAAAAMARRVAVEAFLPFYSRTALCVQTTEDYTAVYRGDAPVTYRKGLNAIEVAQERAFQDEGLSEHEGEALWHIVDILAARLEFLKK